ncbi:GTP 3',8-cyclase MoaA [Candidatus Margulisiibacteriota bacterium]
MPIDTYKRKINYLRVSVTDKCNYRCQYCRPAEGVPLKNHKDILSLEEIYDIVKFFVQAGFEKVRLTGGEPLVRKNIIFLVKNIAALPGLKDFGLTTNGSLLSHFAESLYSAGLKRINISLDTLNPDKFKFLTRGGELGDVIKGIKAAQDVGFYPIKINTVVLKDFNEDDIDDIKQFCKENKLILRLIKEMNLKKGTRYVIENAEAGQCEICNRLRLTCDGRLKPCLFSDYAIDIRKISLEKALEQALHNKPEFGTANALDYMVQIGG